MYKASESIVQPVLPQINLLWRNTQDACSTPDKSFYGETGRMPVPHLINLFMEKHAGCLFPKTGSSRVRQPRAAPERQRK